MDKCKSWCWYGFRVARCKLPADHVKNPKAVYHVSEKNDTWKIDKRER